MRLSGYVRVIPYENVPERKNVCVFSFRLIFILLLKFAIMSFPLGGPLGYTYAHGGIKAAFISKDRHTAPGRTFDHYTIPCV